MYMYYFVQARVAAETLKLCTDPKVMIFIFMTSFVQNFIYQNGIYTPEILVANLKFLGG